MRHDPHFGPCREVARRAAQACAEAEHRVKGRHDGSPDMPLHLRRPGVHGDIHPPVHRPEHEQRDHEAQRVRGKGDGDERQGVEHRETLRYPRRPRPVGPASGEGKGENCARCEAQQHQPQRTAIEVMALRNRRNARGPDAQQRPAQRENGRNGEPQPPVARQIHGYSSPSARKLASISRPMMMWSCTFTPSGFALSAIFLVISISAREGVGSPLG